MARRLIRNIPTIAVLALVGAVALAACGSSSNRPAAKSHADTGIAFSRCLRSHGITDFPDPSSGGGGVQFHISGNGPNPASPAFRSARASCSKLLPGGGPRTHASAKEIKQDTEIAECMREHGVTGFPDPVVTSTPPGINPADYSSAEYGNGIFIGIPKSINVTSPAFEAAAKACGFG
jgi:hypothetical protein